jgi:F-type H+-transporting ATPase subunit b
MDKRFKVVFISILILVLTSAVFAEGEHGGEHKFDWWGFLGKLLNSTILFGGLILLLRKPIINLLAQKSLDVKDDINQREEELTKTSRQLEDLKDRLVKIEEEVADIKKAAEISGNVEKKRIEELGANEARRILELTEAEIATKVENSVRNLKSRIADMTIEHFKKDIGKQLDKKAHERIIEKNIEKCGDIIERK